MARCAAVTDAILARPPQGRAGLLLHGPDLSFLRRIAHATAWAVVEHGRTAGIESTWNIVHGGTGRTTGENRMGQERQADPDRTFLLILEEVGLSAMNTREKIVLWSIVDRRAVPPSDNAVHRPRPGNVP